MTRQQIKRKNEIAKLSLSDEDVLLLTCCVG